MHLCQQDLEIYDPISDYAQIFFDLLLCCRIRKIFLWTVLAKQILCRMFPKIWQCRLFAFVNPLMSYRYQIFIILWWLKPVLQRNNVVKDCCDKRLYNHLPRIVTGECYNSTSIKKPVSFCHVFGYWTNFCLWWYRWAKLIS